MAELDPNGMVNASGVTVYEMPGLAAFDDFLVAHPGQGGEAFNHQLRQIYFSPVRIAFVRALSGEAQRQFWTHEIGHIDMASESARQQHLLPTEADVQASYPIDLVLAEVGAIPLQQPTLAATATRSPFAALNQVVQAVADADPILARLETAGVEALRSVEAARRPIVYLVGSEALKTATGVATLVTLRNQITATGATKLVNIVYVHTDPAVSQKDLFDALQIEADQLFDVAVEAVTQPTDAVRQQIVEAVNANLDEFRQRSGQTIEALPPIRELSRSNTVTMATNAQEPVPVEQRNREERIFNELVKDAIHVLVQQPDSTDTEAVADYSRAVTTTLVALSESKDVPPELKEDIEAVKQAVVEGGTLTIPPRPSSVLHDIDQRFKAQRAVGSQV